MSNINENLEKIQNAIYGEEVRGAIVDSIKQCYDDNARQGNSNAEVIMARGNYKTLRERLDSLDYVSFTMQTEQEIPQNTNFEVPREYRLGGDGLIILAEGSKLIKDINYIEIDSLHIQFKDWDVPAGTNLEFICNTKKVTQSDEAYVQELEEENAAFKNLLPTGKTCGENKTLEDSGEIELKKIRIEGNTRQETREGYNVINVAKPNRSNEATVNYENKVLTVSSTSKITTPCVKYDFNLKQAEKINFSGYILQDNGQVVFQLNNTTIKVLNFSNSKQTYSYTAESDVTFSVLIYADKNIPTTSSSSQYKEIMITKNNSTVDNYEEYGAMPSTEFSSKIESCENSINFNICNKNLFVDDFRKYSRTINYFCCPIKLQNEKEYKIHGELIKEKLSGFVVGIVKSGDNYTNFKDLKIILESTGTAKELSFVADETYTNPKLVMYVGANNFEANFNSIFENYRFQLEESNVKTNYEEHKEQNITFPLKQKLFKSDYLAAHGIHHKRKEIILNGTENWAKWNFESEQYAGFQLDNIDYDNSAGTDARGMSSHFEVLSDTSIQKENISFRQLGDGIKRIYVCIKKERLSSESVAGFKEYLAQQKENGTPVTVVYKLAEEELEEYSEEQKSIYNEIMQKAKSYKGKTHIFGTDSTSAIFDVEYYKDIEAYVNSKMGGVANE